MTRKILYISGFERSGTTLITNTINESDKFISIGELGNLWRKDLYKKGRCGCGRNVSDCDFWRKVLPAIPGER